MTSTHNITLLLQPHFEQGLELWLEGGMLRFKAPKEVLTPALMGLLKQNKEAILSWLQSEQSKKAEPKIVDEYPLAFTQGAIWMLYRFAPNSPAYNTTFACVLNGAVNETAVRQAFHALLIRHPVLRSTFADTDNGPRQRVWDHIEMPLQFIDGSQWNEQQLDEQLNQEADAAFDLQKEPCLRVKIVRNSVRGDILIATIQHVGADLWALLIVAKDIKDYYQRAARGEVLSLEPLAATYRHHVEWQQQFMDSERGKKERRFWQRALRGAPMTVSLPTDFPRPPVLLLQSKIIKQEVESERYRAIRAFCKSHSITPFVFVQAALQLLVSQRTGAQDFLIGTPTMGRSRKGMDQVVGDFANPVVLRAQVQPHATLTSLFQQVKRTLLSAMEHQEYPFPSVVQDCNPPRDSSRTPLFQLMFVWHQGNAEMAQDDWIKSVLPMSGPRGAPYDVMLAVSDLGDRFELNWTYQTSLYRPETVARMGQQVQRFMQQFLQADGNSSVADLVAAIAEDAKQGGADRILPQPQRNLAMESALLEQIPALAGQEFCVIQQSLHGEATQTPIELQRMFIGCGDERRRFDWQLELQQQIQPGQLDDIVLYPQLPRTSAGNIDIAQLAQRPLVDHPAVQVRLRDAGYATDDLLVLRNLVHRPTWESEELASAKKSSTQRAALRALDISQRPDAWATGAPLPPTAVTSSHLFEALQKTAQRYPDRGLTLLDNDLRESRYSYAQLVDDAHVAAAGFQRAGVAPGAIVLLQMRFDRRFFAVWWGAVLAGIRPLNVATPEQYNNRNGVAQKLYNVAHNFAELTVAADRERVDATRFWLGESKQVIDADALLEHSERYELHALSRDPVAFLQLTSGSTGTPKAIQITHHGILHHIAASAVHNDYSSDDISLNWLPFDHVVPILTTHVKDCVLGIQQVQLTTSSVLNDPLLWLKAMADYRVSYSWAPNFAFQRVVDALQQATQLPELDLSCVKILMNAGEQVLAPVVKAFHAGCATFGLKQNAVQPAFGMAEACTCMTYNNESDHLLSVHFNNTLDPTVCDIAPAEQATHGFVDLGSVVPGVEIRITNDRNELVKEGVIGRLQIRGPVVTPGYLNNPDANAEAFVGDGWFNSGDLGFMWNRRLVLTGREKEMIVVRGANYYCFEMEQVVANIAGVVPTFVAATGVALQDGSNSDALVLFYVSDDSVDATQLERQIVARVAEAFGVTAEYVIAVDKDNFYKTTSGKIQRGQFKKNFEKDFYAKEVESWNQRHREPVDSVQTLFALGWRADEVQLLPQQIDMKVDLVQAGAADLPQQLAALATQTQRHLLILLGTLEVGGQVILAGDQLNAQLWQLAQAARSLVPLLQIVDAATAQRITIAVAGSSSEDTLLFKPLLETLRQETGLNLLTGCVIARELALSSELLPSGALLHPGIRHALTAPAALPRWIDSKSTQQPSQQQPQQPVLQAVDANLAQADNLPRSGTWLITGGLGALAEPLCEWLVTRLNAKLILTGRSTLESNRRAQSRFNQLSARFGAEKIRYLPMGDTQPSAWHEKISAQLAPLKSTRLDGIFHLAGHLAMQSLADISAEHWHAVTDSKIQDAFALAQYLQQHWPQAAFVQYGSLNSHFGGQSAAAYSLANAAQVWLTRHLNQHTTIRSWCLNWSVWQGTGMAQQFSAAELRMARNKGLIALDVQRDSVWLEKTLQLPPASYYIGVDAKAEAMETQLDWFARTAEHLHVHLQPPAGAQQPDSQKARDIATSAIREIVPRVGDPVIEQRLWSARWQLDAQQRPEPTQFRAAMDNAASHSVPPANDTEQALCEIWSRVLARPITDVTRSFFEYGGHSINATQLVSAINLRFSTALTVAHLFQYASVRELANSILEQAQSGFLSLALQDCIQRGNDFRLDCVNPDSTSPLNVIFLPTSAGIASAYLQLMAQLKHARLHALSAPLTAAGERPIEESAATFIRLIDQAGIDLQSIILVGWSMGGVQGYEMLKQLAAEKRPLPKLVMLDSGFGVGLHPITFDADFQVLMFAVELGLSIQDFAEFNQQPDLLTKLKWLKQYLATLHIEVTEELLLEWSVAYRKRLKSLETYGKGDELENADITLIKAALHSHGRDDLGWGDTNKNIKWQTVQADHQSVVRHPEVAEWLRQFCQRQAS